MSDGERSERGNGKRRERGIFQRHADGCSRPPSGCDCPWWVVYFDEKGRKHREKVGPKGLALKVYQKRKNEITERRFFPERIRRRDMLVAKMVDDYLNRVGSSLATRMRDDTESFGRKPLERARSVRSHLATSSAH
jgi:hypothetical protein